MATPSIRQQTCVACHAHRTIDSTDSPHYSMLMHRRLPFATTGNFAMHVWKSAIVKAILLGACSGVLAWGASNNSSYANSVLNRSEADRCVGAACPNIGCVAGTCAPDNSCLSQEMLAYTCAPLKKPRNSKKCIKIISNAFAICGDPGSEANKTCSETSGNGCITEKTGDQDANGDCSPDFCTSDAGSCGPTSYTCTATGCE